MKGSMTWDYDTDDGECFDLHIVYEYVPYSPPVLTADPYFSEPADGGGCEEIIFKVTGYRQYDKDNNILQDLETLTPEQEKELTDKFQKLHDSSFKIQDYFQRRCSEHAERSMEPDWD